MDIRALTDDYAVSPQIDPSDIPAIRDAGYTTIISNRPDAENPPELRNDEMRRAAEAAGLTFVENPVIGGALTEDNVTAQAAAREAATGPVLAYCASGNRSSIMWALTEAGNLATDDIIATPSRYGYNLEPVRGLIDALAARK